MVPADSRPRGRRPTFGRQMQSPTRWRDLGLNAAWRKRAQGAPRPNNQIERFDLTVLRLLPPTTSWSAPLLSTLCSVWLSRSLDSIRAEQCQFAWSFRQAFCAIESSFAQLPGTATLEWGGEKA